MKSIAVVHWIRYVAMTAVCFWIGFAIVPTRPGRAEEATWQAGLAKAVITPETPVWLAGYGSKRPPDGKLHELWMKALALEDSTGRRVVLVTSDFQGVPKSMSDRVFSRLQIQYGLERHQVMVTFSHNHCGPRLGDDLIDYYPVEAEQEQLVKEYTNQMVDRMVSLVGQSLENLAPAELRMGEGRATFAVNRRNNKEAEVADKIAQGEPLVGPVDHSVPILTVARPDGKLAAVLFGYACHPTTLSFFTWCGDYPGFAQVEIEAKHPGTMAMFVNTCGGDQNPLPRRSVELCQNYGHQLAVAVEEALKPDLPRIDPELNTAFELIDLPYLQVISREELHQAMQGDNAIRARWAARLLQKLDKGEKFPAAYPYPIHAWRLGKQMLMIGMGAETVVDYALRFKREFGPGTWVCGYADDMIAYIPSRRVWEEGGYEGGSNLYEYGRPAYRWAGEIEDRIAASVHRQVEWARQPRVALPVPAKRPQRRVLYNFDGDSCMTTRAGGKGPVAITVEDVRKLVAEVAYPGSQVDTILLCVNAQVMYYPTRIGTQRGYNSTAEEKAKWPPTQKQLYENLKRFYDAGVDPYALLIAESRRQGRETLLSFRMNDDHGDDFLRTQFWAEHPEYRLGKGALDFKHDAVRDYVARLIEEALRRYDTDGIELDFNRFPAFFQDGTLEERGAWMNALVERVRTMVDQVGTERRRRMVLAVRVPSNFGRTPPTPASAKALGCDVPLWVERGWINFVTVSEFLFTRYDLSLAEWKSAIRSVPVYGGIECTEGGSKEQYLTAAKYREAAGNLERQRADGIYLFNFFTTREYGAESWEPPFEVLQQLTTSKDGPAELPDQGAK
ncbi:MAG: hypothetical protein FJ295_15805 [Planctomycetes bacterium]|nr:hypothetical protein [Planctomycetota bacterium]